MINDESVYVNCLYLYNIFGIIGIFEVKQYNPYTEYFDVDILWSNENNNNNNNKTLVHKSVFFSNISYGLWREIRPNEIDVLVNHYKLKICTL